MRKKLIIPENTPQKLKDFLSGLEIETRSTLDISEPIRDDGNWIVDYTHKTCHFAIGYSDLKAFGVSLLKRGREKDIIIYDDGFNFISNSSEQITQYITEKLSEWELVK